MTPGEGVALLGLCASAFLLCLASSLSPAGSVEAALVLVSAAAQPAEVVPILLAGTSGQMVAKSLVYLAGRGVMRIPRLPGEARLEAVRARLAEHRTGATSLLLGSAFAGLPPFYLVTVLAGSLRWPYLRFVALGACGRLARNGLALLLPQALKALS
jgi:membrane protein YqaA with SNARE-associated domain